MYSKNYKHLYRNHYSPSIQTYTIKNILIDKDDYTQIEKQDMNLVRIIINRLDKINNDVKEILVLNTLTAIIKHTISLDKEMSSSLILNQKYFSSMMMSSHRRTYDRSSSAYAPKKRSDRFREKEFNDMKLFDCQERCRREYHRRHQSDYILSHARPHYRHRKRKLPVCYRYFPFFLNALANDKNIQKQCINNRCHTKSTNHIIQLKSKKSTRSKVLVDIQKVPCADINSKEKLQDSLPCFGTGTINFVDRSSGPVLCLKKYRSTANEENYLYQHVLNSGDEWDINSPESSIMNVSKQTLTSHHTFTFQTLFLNESVSCLLYQSPLGTVTEFCLKLAATVIFINCTTKISLIQLPYLTYIIPDSDNTHPWQYQLSVHIRLIDNINDVQSNDEKSSEELASTNQLILDKKSSILDNEERNREFKSNSVIIPDQSNGINGGTTPLFSKLDEIVNEFSTDELHINIPRCLQICDSFEQRIPQQSTVHNLLHIDTHQNEEDSLKRTLSYQTKTSRIMTTGRQSSDDIIPSSDSNSAHQQQKKYYVKNQFSDVQLNKSSSQPRKRLKCKQKINPRRQKLVRSKWVSPVTHTHHIKRLPDPCQMLEIYAQFRRIHCICTPINSHL